MAADIILFQISAHLPIAGERERDSNFSRSSLLKGEKLVVEYQAIGLDNQLSMEIDQGHMFWIATPCQMQQRYGAGLSADNIRRFTLYRLFSGRRREMTLAPSVVPVL